MKNGSSIEVGANSAFKRVHTPAANPIIAPYFGPSNILVTKVGININSAIEAPALGIAVTITKQIISASITPKKVSLLVLILVFIKFPPVLVLPVCIAKVYFFKIYFFNNT